MSARKHFFAVLCLSGALSAAAATAAGMETRVLSAADAREGPGAYYPQGVRILPGSVVRILQERKGWVQAEVQSQRGWIPAYTLEFAQRSSSPGQLIRAASKSLLRAMTSMVRPADKKAYLTYPQVTLGIRGFAGAFASHRGQQVQEADANLWEKPSVGVKGYDDFLESRFNGRDWESLKRRLPLDTPAPLPDPDADKLGAALAGFIAQQYKLRRDAALEAYLSQVATLVAESSHAYDVPARVYVLRSPQVLGFVTPHGIIFVSDGALRKMRSEAEFAFFVGHEIAHVAFGHGPRKLQRDDKRQQEEGAFAEMEQDLAWDESTDDKYVRTNQELSEMADQIHEYFQSESNDQDELAADYWGLIYAARAGYVPEAAENLLVRIAADTSGGKSSDGSQLLWRGTDSKPRLEQVRRTYTVIKVERTEFRSFETEFQSAAGNKKPAGG